jgi:NTP pyrophosphatase (non-canonical NTP hydrolase)
MDILERLRIASSDRARFFPDYKRLLAKDVLYYSNALAGEVGEACNVVKKMERGDALARGVPVRDALSDELADVLIQLDLLAQAAGINLRNALITKFNVKSSEMGANIFL